MLPFTVFLPPPEWAALGYVAIGGLLLAIGNGLLYYSFDRLPAHRRLIIKPLSTAMAALLGVILLGDPWTVPLLIGGLLVIVSTIIVGVNNKAPVVDPNRQARS